MSGVTKHIFNQEVRDILSMWDCEIKTIEPLLPKEYSSGDIITLLKEFYPHEWHSVEIKYVYYQTKDRYIKRKSFLRILLLSYKCKYATFSHVISMIIDILTFL